MRAYFTIVARDIERALRTRIWTSREDQVAHIAEQLEHAVAWKTRKLRTALIRTATWVRPDGSIDKFCPCWCDRPPADTEPILLQHSDECSYRRKALRYEAAEVIG